MTFRLWFFKIIQPVWSQRIKYEYNYLRVLVICDPRRWFILDLFFLLHILLSGLILLCRLCSCSLFSIHEGGAMSNPCNSLVFQKGLLRYVSLTPYLLFECFLPSVHLVAIYRTTCQFFACCMLTFLFLVCYLWNHCRGQIASPLYDYPQLYARYSSQCFTCSVMSQKVHHITYNVFLSVGHFLFGSSHYS